MPLYRKGLHIIEARQLIGTAAETMDVIHWVMNVGEFYWLIGNALKPETLIPEGGGGVAGDPGVYIDPSTGDFIIHKIDGDIRASYGDWLIFDDDFIKYTSEDFQATYKPA